MEDDTTVVDAIQKEETKKNSKGWELVDRFMEPLEKYERFSVFLFIMIVFFLITGFVLGWVVAILGGKIVCAGLWM